MNYPKLIVIILIFFSSLVNQLHYNELYDLYRDDYKLLKNKNEKPNEQNSKNIKLLPGYQNVVAPDKYVSCHTWHPTIPGNSGVV